MALGGVEIQRLCAVDGQDECRRGGGRAIGLEDEAGEEAGRERNTRSGWV